MATGSGGLVQSDIEHEDVDAGITQEAQAGLVGVFVDQIDDFVLWRSCGRRQHAWACNRARLRG